MKKITVNKKAVTFSLLALLLLIIGSTSYAYFTATIEGNDTAKQTSVTSGTMSVKLINTEEINLNGMMPGDSKEVHFSVQNTGSATAIYGVGLLVSENNFGDKTDLVYTITSDNAGGSKAQSVLPSKSTTPSTLIPVISIPTGKTQNYTMTITFKETNDAQNDNQGKTFSGKIQLVDANRNLLATNILTSQPISKINNYEYVWTEIENNKTVNLDTTTTLNGPGICVTESMDNIKHIGDNTYLPYDMTSSTCNITNPENYIGWYTFGYNDNINGAEIYKIGAAEGTVITNADYTKYTLEGEGLIEETDDLGTSYVFRGSITNNYISFANKLWQIVRINGDGSIRIAMLDSAGESALNDYDNDIKYYGYTYDNSTPNVQDGTPSTLKAFLDSWYNDNISKKGYDSKVVESIYCNDTSNRKNGDDVIFGAYDRITNNNPSLVCPPTTENYGGKYNLKVGILSADEMMMSGFGYYANYAPSSTYLYRPNATYGGYYLTISPALTRNGVKYKFINYSDSVTDDPSINWNSSIFPVINLKADTIVISGNGTKANPYIVE